MKRKKNHRFLLTILLTIFVGLACVFFFNEALAENIELVLVPVASRNLCPNQKVSTSDLEYIKVPKNYIPKNILLSDEEIINQFVKPYYTISQNSFFYQDSINQTKQLSQGEIFNLKEGEVALSIPILKEKNYVNWIKPGHVIDLYYLGKAQINQQIKEYIVYGKICENIRVIALVDQHGNLVNEEDDFVIDSIIVALNNEQASLIKIAQQQGEVSPVVSYSNISNQKSEQYYDQNKLRNIILGNSIDLTLVNELKDE